MVREIKFRAKYFDEWYFGIIVTRKVKDKGRMRNIYILMGLDNENWIPLREDQYDTIGQFTGLHDKNGKEIYEGDIVRTLVSRLNATKNKKYRNFVIRYDAPHFWNGYDSILMRPMYMEVIGNIYDNPELLKED